MKGVPQPSTATTGHQVPSLLPPLKPSHKTKPKKAAAAKVVKLKIADHKKAPPKAVSDLIKNMRQKPDEASRKDILRAYELAQEAHAGQKRASGEDYIAHPLAVAHITAELGGDTQSVVAALLHDTLEDSRLFDSARLRREFGSDLALLIKGLSKFTETWFTSDSIRQNANLAKLIQASTRDIRVFIVKLADRLHNMRTLAALPRTKQLRIIRETLDFYAPLAARLGLRELRRQLEDLSLQILHPLRYEVIRARVDHDRKPREQELAQIVSSLRESIAGSGITIEAHSGEHHLYALYRSMKDDLASFSDARGAYKVTLATAREEDCYRVLGAIHKLCNPVAGKFRDAIAVPHSNSLKLLHTTVVTPPHLAIEISICTDQTAELLRLGVVPLLQRSHSSDIHGWLADWRELEEEKTDNSQFTEDFRADLRVRESIVYSADGRAHSLPECASALDFAYISEPKAANNATAVNIDGHERSLSTVPRSGQTLELICDSDARPQLLWLDFATTPKARAAIRRYFQKFGREQAIMLGREQLTHAFKKRHPADSAAGALSERVLRRVAEGLRLKNADDLHLRIGLGRLSIQEALTRIEDSRHNTGGKTSPSPRQPATPRLKAIRLVEGNADRRLSLAIADCCQPIPGDPIIGTWEALDRVSVHRRQCPESRGRRGTSQVAVAWADTWSHKAVGCLRAEIVNRPRVLAAITRILGDMEVNIEKLDLACVGEIQVLHISLAISGREQLGEVIRKLSRLDKVQRIERV